ncbi:MAG: hypothetical protein ACK5LK_02560 [Chthoniobacterales bacterium]
MSLRIATAWCVCLAVTVISSLASAALGITPSPLSAGIALAFGGLSGLFAAFSIRLPFAYSERWTPACILLIGLFAWATWRAFFWLLFQNGAALNISSPYNLGDISLHLQFIQSFATISSFPPQSPIFAGVPLRYPLGADWFNAQLFLLGVPLDRGLIWVGLLAGIALIVTLRSWGGAFTIATFLFICGFAAWPFFSSGLLADYQSDLAWKNPFLTIWVTQRGFYYALPAALLLLLSWRNRLAGDKGYLPLFLEGLLYASMPLFHVHTFLFLSFALLVFFLYELPRSGILTAWRQHWFLLVLSALLPATAFTWLVTGGLAAQSAIAWHPGWLVENGPVVEQIKFWFLNFGLWLVAAPLALLLGWMQRSKSIRFRIDALFAFIGLFVFAACCLFRFAPWAWDNTKLMLLCWLVLAPGIWHVLVFPLERPVRVLLCFLFFFTGAISLIGGLQNPTNYKLAERSELAAVSTALQSLPANAVFVHSGDFNHPLALLGQQVSVGYNGHLWSHGYDYAARERAVHEVFKGKLEALSYLQKFGANYLFVGQREITKEDGGILILTPFLKKVSSGKGFEIFELNEDLIQKIETH